MGDTFMLGKKNHTFCQVAALCFSFIQLHALLGDQELLLHNDLTATDKYYLNTDW